MAVKKTGYKYVWFKNNKVFVKKMKAQKQLLLKTKSVSQKLFNHF